MMQLVLFTPAAAAVMAQWRAKPRCEALKEIYLPLNITDVYSDAFHWCPIEKVFYSGTEDSRKTMVIDAGNQSLNDASWIYSLSIPIDPLNALFLPKTLKTIESEAFSGVTAQAVIIPNTVETIEPYQSFFISFDLFV